jgi:Ubiquitin-2 like Rad60 SUMO-like
MPDIDVTFRNENNGKEVEVTVSDDMPADAILRNLAEAGLIPNTPGTALVYRGMQLRPNQTLGQFGVTQSDVVSIFLNTRGGQSTATKLL